MPKINLESVTQYNVPEGTNCGITHAVIQNTLEEYKRNGGHEAKSYVQAVLEQVVDASYDGTMTCDDLDTIAEHLAQAFVEIPPKND